MRVRVFEFWNNVVVFGFREKVTTAFFKAKPEWDLRAKDQKSTGETKILAPGTPPSDVACFTCSTQFILRMVVNRLLSSDVDAVIFDRYIFDQLATLPIEHKAVRAYARVIAKLAPRPDIAYLLDADPEAAFARKPEYPLDFLCQYRQCYLTLKELLGTITLIGSHPLEETQRRLAIEFQKADFSPATQALS